ncbi:MAG: HAMP domain-containing sensor histidine kinase, partial [Planctomycetota bacterium]
TIQLDARRENDRRESELARQEAELQERIASALYRLDLFLLPVVAREAGNPYYFYSAFYKVPSINLPDPNYYDSQITWTPPRPTDVPPFASPLLAQNSDYVKLHYQLTKDGTVSSPKLPDKIWQNFAADFYNLPKNQFSETGALIEETRGFCTFDVLAEKLGIGEDLLPDSVSQMASVYEVPVINKIAEKIKESKLKSLADSQSWLQKPSVDKITIQKNRGDQRVNEDFNRRRDATRNLAIQQQNTLGNSLPPLFNNSPDFQTNDQQIEYRNKKSEAVTGAMQPYWLNDQLVLARQIQFQDEVRFQCCWLDWQQIETAMQNEIRDVLPNVVFQPIRLDSDLNLGTALTTLPVQLVVDSSTILPTLSLDRGRKLDDPSGLKVALLFAWILMVIAVLASALMLNGVMKLSERRASFVSAVTHELRTPLTTFRMYAEMLAEKMVPEHRQQEYANTLKIQSERLAHLVENVLQYAKLERNPASFAPETCAIADLVDRFSTRLKDRCEIDSRSLRIEIEDSLKQTTIRTQPGHIEQILFNLVDNACKYASPAEKDEILIRISRTGSRVQLIVRDYGPGILPAQRRRIFLPFHKSDLEAANTAPGVGLGLALCKRMAQTLGGSLRQENGEPGSRFILEIPI